jgi:hypothetical protein
MGYRDSMKADTANGIDGSGQHRGNRTTPPDGVWCGL